MVKVLCRLNDFLNRILMIAGGAAVLALMALATGNVVLRIFEVPFRGTYEIVSFLGAITVASALAYTQKRRDHIVVDVLAEKFPPPLLRFVTIASDAVVALFFSVVSCKMAAWGWKIMQSGELSETLKVPYHPYIFAVAFCCALLAFTAAVDFLAKILQKEAGRS
jgi:TRAP-type C4-dicarboxylate transport system permease small subunit